MFHIDRIPSQAVTTSDPASGLPVTRLTGGIGHSHGLYFTSECWTRDGAHLFLAAERAPYGNQLYACELASGDLFRLTDLPPSSDLPHIFNYAALSPVGDEIFYWYANELHRLDLTDGSDIVLHRCPDGMRIHGISVTADGSRALTCQSQDLSARLGPRDGTNVAIERDYLAAKPRSQVVSVPRDGGTATILWDEAYSITHINASPTDPDLAIFCHEGPWLEIDHRIWGLRLSGGDPWPILARDPDWGVGHEYWLADGRTIGYHARYREGTWRQAAGFVDALDDSSWQAELAMPTHHAIGVDQTCVILDSTREAGDYLCLALRDGATWGEPRMVCGHFSSRHHHRAHVHAHLRHDRRQIAFTSDRRTYADVYLVDLPEDLTTLPPYPGRPYRYYWQ